MEVREKYKKCPICEGIPRIEEINEIVFVECECGLSLAMDHEGNELL